MALRDVSSVTGTLSAVERASVGLSQQVCVIARFKPDLMASISKLVD